MSLQLRSRDSPPFFEGMTVCREQLLIHSGPPQEVALVYQTYSCSTVMFNTIVTKQSSCLSAKMSSVAVYKRDAVWNVQFLISILNMVCSSCRYECSSCEVGEQCGVIMHGNAVTFCEPYGPRELVGEGWNCRLWIYQGWNCRLWIEAVSDVEM